MKPVQLQVQMLGTFTLKSGSNTVSEEDNRSKKMWLLLAYMIYRRDKSISTQEYIDLLWGEEESSANPQNALKTLFHRLRSTLDGLWPSAGHQLILRKGSTYVWNPEIPIRVDVEIFDRLCKEASKTVDEEKRLQTYIEAISLYRGDFLARFGSHIWFIPIATYYHQNYLQLVTSALPMLEERQRFSQMTEICRDAITQEPYAEELYCSLMKALIRLGDQNGAISVYEDMSKLFMNNFGIMPTDEARAVYREALRSTDNHAIVADSLLEQLREPSELSGALVCDYDIFRSIYHSLARFVVRSGDAVHLALIQIQPRKKGAELSRRSMDRVIENLEELIRTSLRRGDVVSRCSGSQFIIMLPQANFENSQMICGRILRTFARQYPHSPAELSFSIHPLEPN